jgi:hypothetical protein
VSLRLLGIVLVALLPAACAKTPPTLVSVPDEDNRVEILTSVAGWEVRAADLTACVLRIDHPGRCTEPTPPTCDTRSKADVLRPVQPILDSLPKVRLASSLSMGRDLRALFPSATATSEVLDARRSRACGDWSDSTRACYAIRTAAIAFVFEGRKGASPERIVIVQVAPACGQNRPDRESGS